MTTKLTKSFLIKPDPKRFASHTPTKKITRRFQTPKSPRSTNYSKRFFDFQQIYSQIGTINPGKKEDAFNSCFSEGKEIGTGSFSTVTRKRFGKNNKYYALKRSHQYTKSTDRKRFVEEVFKNVELFTNSSKSLGSRYVVRTKCAFEEFGSLCIVSQYCEGGSLEQCLNKTLENQQILPEEQIWEILTDSLLALEFIHSKGFVHMDIKPENILIHKNKYKLCDFGNMIKEGEEFEDGDSRYLAPNALGEVFNYVPAKKTYDIYSLGATIYQLSVGDAELPTGGEFWEQLRSITKETRLPYKCQRSKELKDIIIKMMLVDENERATLEELFHQEHIVGLLKKKFGNSWDQRFSPPNIKNLKNKKEAANNDVTANILKNNLFSKVKTVFGSVCSRKKYNKSINDGKETNINHNIIGEENILNPNRKDVNNNLFNGFNNNANNNLEYSDFNFFEKQLNENSIEIIENGLKNLNTKQSKNKNKKLKKKRKNTKKSTNKNKNNNKNKNHSTSNNKSISNDKKKEKKCKKKKKLNKKSKKKKKLTLLEEEFQRFPRIRTHSKTHLLMDDDEFENLLNNNNNIKNANKNIEKKNIFKSKSNYSDKNYQNENKVTSIITIKPKTLLHHLSSPTPKRRRRLNKKIKCTKKLFGTFENINTNSIGSQKIDFDLELDSIDQSFDVNKNNI
ncbi:membrane-associated tyrosine- and threonine-specific cdc2-inhibitory kinase [Anaeramoeba flamelloides]|uniref:non-specific serine/threonine protein kinase n=1 Tax=Anaeramoeba flamelloides TaxID=1746091 RepID=A0ABQ8YF64_9EUKA|nr:membrane-associated tyrosine- and threonine-specific cdc2-inhibitory kinase [Anaeramoeba flamelloides]